MAGIKIQGNTGTGFVDKFFVDTSGNVNFTGKLNGATGSFSGELTSATFKSGSININERFKVDALGNCTATSMSITGGSFNTGTINGTSINGGSLNIGNGNFTVNSYGRCVARDIDIVGGSINIDEDVSIGEILTLNGDNGFIEFISGTGSVLGKIGISSGDRWFTFTNSMSVFGDINCTDTIDAYSININGYPATTTRDLNEYTLFDEFASYCPYGTAYDSDTGNLKFYNAYGSELRDMRVNLL